MLTINISYNCWNLLMPIAQNKRKLIAAAALFIAVGALTGAIATGGAATISFATTQGQQDGGATTGQQDGGATTGQQGGGQERIVRQGTVTSEPVPLPEFEGQERATILPLREDGSIYSGVLTYTATEAVDVVILNIQNLNETERSILNATEDGELGTLVTSQIDNETSIAVTSITPTYGDAPAPSASIPFAGNALWLHTADGTPFAATYAISAQVLPAETQNTISNATLAVAEEEDAAAAEEEDAAAAEEEDAAAAEEEDAAAADAEDEADAEEDTETPPTTPA
jgi:hypothetical protein